MTEIEWVDAAFVLNPDKAEAFDALALTLGAVRSVREVKDNAPCAAGMWNIDPYDLGGCGECILSGWVHAGWEDDIAKLVDMCEPTSFAVIHDDSYDCWTKIEKTEEGVAVDQLELRNPFDRREVETLLRWHDEAIDGVVRRAEQDVAKLDDVIYDERGKVENDLYARRSALAGSLTRLGKAKSQIAGINNMVRQVQKDIVKAMPQEIKKAEESSITGRAPASSLTATLANAQGASRHAEADGKAFASRDRQKER